MLERFLLLYLLLLSLFAYKCKQWLGIDPFAGWGPRLPYVIMVTMFAIGWMLQRDEVLQVFRRWRVILLGTALQYLSMPLLAYAIGRLFGLQGDLLVGIMMVGCVPGAMASNVLTLVARGNVSYSVSLTTSATILSPLFVPLALRFALGAEMPAALVQRSIVTLCWTVVAPVIVGHLVGHQFSQWRDTARKVGSTVANLSILWIIAVVVALNRERLASMQPILVWALLSLNLAGYLAGYLGGRAMGIPPDMRRALILEVGMQNAGLGATMALALFADRQATAIPPALFTFGCMLTGTVLARCWATWGNAEPSV